MGFLTPILVRNDCLSEIVAASNGAIRRGISRACADGNAGGIPVGSCASAMMSLGTRHADVSRLIMVDGNTWVDLSSEFVNFSREDDLWIKCLEEDVEKAEAVLGDLKEKLANFRAAKETGDE